MAAQVFVPLRLALRAATPLALDESWVAHCLGSDDNDLLFTTASEHGLVALDPTQRRGHLSRVTGEVAEALAMRLLDEIGYQLFWQLVEPGARGVDLLFLSPDEAVLALEVKGTLRPGVIPRLTPSALRQMSRDWLNGPDNPAMTEWGLVADDLFAGVAIFDLARMHVRVAVSGDFESYGVPPLRWTSAD